MADARAAARALGGDVSGNRVVCPGPGHSSGDRSLAILFDPGSPDGFVLHSHAGDDWRTCRDYVRERLGISRDAPPEPVRSDNRPEPTNAERSAYALALWEQARPIGGTPAEGYLRFRGVWAALPDSADGEALRWHQHCPFGRDRSGAMVALVRDIRTNEPRAIHRTAIDSQGRKRDALGNKGRKALGPVRGGAVKLSADADVTLSVGVGEGIETTLSIRRLPGFENQHVWALISAPGIAAFPALAGLSAVFIAVDNDANGAGREASGRAIDRLTHAGIEVTTITPAAVGADLNDLQLE